MPFSIVTGDILDVRADALVLPSNEQLVIDGGVGLKVARAAGRRKLQRACDAQAGCETGAAVVTPAFSLRAKHIVHVVGPIWRGGASGEEELLAQAYRSALMAAYDAGDASVALPLISAGTYGYPADQALSVAVRSIRSFLDERDLDVRLVLFSRDAVRAGLRNAEELSRYLDEARFDMDYAGPSHDEASDASYSSVFRPSAESWWPDAGFTGSISLDAAPAMAPSAEMEAEGETEEEAEAEGEAGRAPELAPEPATEPATEASSLAHCSRCGAVVSTTMWYCPRCGYEVFRDFSQKERWDSREYDVQASYPAQFDREWQSQAAGNASAAPDSERMQAPLAGRGHHVSAHLPKPQPKSGRERERIFSGKQETSSASRHADLDSWLAQADESLSDMLLDLIDQRGYTDAQVYKRANISRQVFNKIKNDPNYHPKKPTVLALCVALELSVPETKDVLSRAGYALNRSNTFDLIVEFYLARGCFDHFEINEALFAYDQPLLGAS